MIGRADNYRSTFGESALEDAGVGGRGTVADSLLSLGSATSRHISGFNLLEE